jgi:hypothetical protein
MMQVKGILNSVEDLGMALVTATPRTMTWGLAVEDDPLCGIKHSAIFTF